MDENGLEIVGLSHRYSLAWALRDVSFFVRARESVAILGPNGCGKSTLLKILATRLWPTRGDCFLFGRNLRQEAKKIRPDIEWLGHELGLYKTLTPVENLRFNFRLRGEKPCLKKIDEVLQEVGLNGAQNKLVVSLSAGQKKRVALARILLKKQKLILLDEPHAHLDKEGRVWMNRSIARWKKEGTTLLMASHDDKEILPLCDKTLVLNEGRLKQ